MASYSKKVMQQISKANNHSFHNVTFRIFLNAFCRSPLQNQNIESLVLLYLILLLNRVLYLVIKPHQSSEAGSLCIIQLK